jgi:hypothetical protein
MLHEWRNRLVSISLNGIFWKRKHDANARQPAQVLVLFALASIPLMGFTGLAVDGGNILAQRRIVQNGADAGALAGVRDLIRSTPSPDALNTARTYASTNAAAGFQAKDATVTIDPVFIDNSGTPGVDPSLATGVKVTVTKTFATYFIGVLGISTRTVSAVAIGKIQKWSGGTGPFLVCGDGLKEGTNLNDNNSETNDWLPGGILDYSTNPPKVRPQALNVDFFVHGSRLGQNDGDCGWESSNSTQYKGVGEQSFAGCTTSPCSYPYNNGATSGQVTYSVAGLTPCQGTSDDFTEGCVAILPVVARKTDTAANTCNPTTPDGSMCVRAWVPFQLKTGPTVANGCTGSNCHVGRIIETVLLTNTAGVDCTPPCTGAVMIKLSQ